MTAYFLLFFVAACELSPKVDTTNIIKKIGICLMIIGALIEIAGKHNDLPIIGIAVYFSANILSAHFTMRTRRKTDK